jgi:methylenetetrahydrofolate dehydrogenase (NADP+) / methenyltetrahydrofolate cyclohydrolase
LFLILFLIFWYFFGISFLRSSRKLRALCVQKVPSPADLFKNMTAQLIDGIALSTQLRKDVATRAAALKAQGITPGLTVVLVGDNPASAVYVRNKVKACADNGLQSVLEKHDATMSQAALLALVNKLNNDPSVHGILVQLPLPAHIDAHKVIEAIAPEKDVDGFHVASAGALMVGQPGFWPCTPYGCMKMLQSIGYQLKGKHAVVIGRSNIVGKPMALMLLQQNATVSICHSATKDLKAMTLQADVIVAAVGKRNVLTADMVKPGAVVIDVGMNRNDEGKLCGDVDFEGVKEVASYITPVPGGVGPMTITMLLVNTIEAAERVAAKA